MLLRDICNRFVFPLVIYLFIYFNFLLIVSIPIMGIGLSTICGIAVEGGTVCEICSPPSTSGDALNDENETPKGMYYQL